jgi:Hepatocellular carcinoma-associated antigen 59
MFKKRTAGAKQKAFRKSKATPGEDDDDAEDDDAQAASTLQQQIQQTKKKRKLLTDAQYKRGVGAEELLLQKTDELKDGETGAGDHDATADGGRSKDSNSNLATSRDGILEQKHSEAMAKYIEEQMDEAKTAAAQGQSQADSLPTQDNETNKKSAVLLTKDALYAELAVTSQRLAGKIDNSSNNNTDNNNAAGTISTDDLGSGGAVLVAGTGIAEVILPVEERLQVARETEKAQQQHQLKRAAARNKASSASAGSTVVAPRPQGLPNRFFIPSRPQPQTATADGSKTNVAGTMDEEPVATAAVDNDRIGFEARQRQKEGPGAGHGGKKSTSTSSSSAPPLHHRDRANDLRVYRNFVSRERDKKK